MKRVLAICLGLAVLIPASASATTVKLGPAVPGTPSGAPACSTFNECPSQTYFQQTVPDPSIAIAAPGDGKVTSWGATGAGLIKLRVLRPVGALVVGEGTSAAVAADKSGGPYTTSLPIRAGDLIGVDIATNGDIDRTEQTGAAYGGSEPAVPEDGSPHALNLGEADYELLINATVVLAPTVAGIVPASGSILGGDTVKIVGNFLDGATGVLFGAMPATFTVDSANQITAVAPATPPSTVDVRVIGPGGTSATSAADRYTFTALGTAAAPTLISPLAAGVRPTVTGLGQTASRWRRGSQLAKISRAPVGTTFSFSLSKAATVRLQFSQRAGGRKVRGSCRPPSPSNVGRPRCKRTVVAGALSLQGHAGLNKIRFQGRLSNSKSLKVGRYTLSLTARDAGGLQSASRSLGFEIVN